MSGQYRKISKPVANKKTLTPLLQLIRDALTRVRRAGNEHGNVMMENNRFAEELVSKEPGAPFLPGGVSHKVAANYYLGRDGRRLMTPPADVNKFEKKSVGENWGLKCPTPGTGVHWHREHHNEWPHLKRDGELNFLDKYDSFKK